MILDCEAIECASNQAAQLCSTELHTSYAEMILDYEVIKLHNFVVQSHNELLILGHNFVVQSHNELLILGHNFVVQSHNELLILGHNFVVQSHNELLILDCASNRAAQLCSTELHTSYAEMILDCASNRVQKITSNS